MNTVYMNVSTTLTSEQLFDTHYSSALKIHRERIAEDE